MIDLTWFGIARDGGIEKSARAIIQWNHSAQSRNKNAEDSKRLLVPVI